MNPEIVAEERFDILGKLPKEICYKILLYLTPNDIANSFNCCKKWQQLINWKFIWKKINRGSDSDEEPKSKIYQKMVRSYSVYGQGRFMYYRGLKYNVKNHKYRQLRIDVNHDDYNKYEFRFVHMDDRITILGSQWKSTEPNVQRFFIINSSCGLVEKTIKFINFDGYVALKQFNYLVAVAIDRELRIWNIEDGELIAEHIFEGDGRSNTIAACKHLIIILNEHDVVYVVDLRTMEWRYISTAKYACCSKNLIAFLQHDGDIIIRDADYRIVMSFSSSAARFIDLSRGHIYSMQMNEDFLVMEETRITNLLSIFNLKTKVNFYLTKPGGKPSYFKISKSRLVFTVYTYGRPAHLEIWDMCTEICLYTIGKVESHILALHLNDSYIYIRSSKHKWQMWCLQTGEFVREFKFCDGNENIIAVTNSKLIFKSARWDSHWHIRDFEDNLYQKKKKNKKQKNNTICIKKRKLMP